MRFLCRAYTLGGPVAVMRREDVLAWKGAIGDDDGHYSAACEAVKGKRGIIIYLPDCQYLVIILQKENENFHVFYDKNAFAVVSEDYAESGHEMRIKVPSFATATGQAKLGELKDFGGKIVIFDAAVPGEWITLQETGSENAIPTDVPLKTFADNTALVEVAEGDWEVSAIDYKDEFLGYHGLLFRFLRKE